MSSVIQQPPTREADTHGEARARFLGGLTQVLALAATVIGLVSLLGHLSDLEVVYRWHGSGRMSPYSAGLLVLVGAAVWLNRYRSVIAAGRFADRDDRRIQLIASALLVLVASTAGSGGFVLMAQRLEESSRAALLQSLLRDADHVRRELRAQRREWEVAVARLVREETLTPAVLEAVLNDARLPALTAALQPRDGSTVRVCVSAGSQVLCHPALPSRSGSEWLRMGRLAVTGEQGTMLLRDADGVRVVAAYTSIEPGLGFILEQDSERMYGAHRDSRVTLALVLGAVIALGLALTHSLIGPLVRRAREARAAALEHDTRTTAIMNSVAHGIVTVDDTGSIAAVNPALCTMFGYEERELLKQPAGLLFPDGLRALGKQSWRQCVREIVAQPMPDATEVAGRRHDGSSFAALLTLTPMHLGSTAYLVGNVRDVTLAKIAEADLRGANDRFKLAAQAARLGVFECDLSTGTWIWDARVQELHDVATIPTYEEWRRLVHPNDLQRMEHAVNDAIAQHRALEFEFRLTLPKGVERTVHTAAMVVRDDAGEAVRLTGVMWDVTESKRLERMKSEFVSVVSHELRTPLTSIRGALGLLASSPQLSLPDKLRQLLDIAYRNTDRLALLIGDILDVERIESGGLSFASEPVDVRELVQQAIDNNQAYAAERGVHLQLVTSSGEDITVTGDTNRLLQVLANLLSNAAKFSPAGASVDIAILKMTSGVRISVRDYGSGIPASFQPRVFQKFAQADASDSRAKGGTGLGLAISKAIVDRHGGRIGYDSRPGVGTLFYFDLPLPAQDLSQTGTWRGRLLHGESRTGGA